MESQQRNVIRETATDNIDIVDMHHLAHREGNVALTIPVHEYLKPIEGFMFGVGMGFTTVFQNHLMASAIREVFDDMIEDRRGDFNPEIPQRYLEDPQLRQRFYDPNLTETDVRQIYYDEFITNNGPGSDRVRHAIATTRVRVEYPYEDTIADHIVAVPRERQEIRAQGHMNVQALSNLPPLLEEEDAEEDLDDSEEDRPLSTKEQEDEDVKEFGQKCIDFMRAAREVGIELYPDQVYKIMYKYTEQISIENVCGYKTETDVIKEVLKENLELDMSHSDAKLEHLQEWFPEGPSPGLKQFCIDQIKNHKKRKLEMYERDLALLPTLAEKVWHSQVPDLPSAYAIVNDMNGLEPEFVYEGDQEELDPPMFIGKGHMYTDCFDQVEQRLEVELNYDRATEEIASVMRRFGDVHVNKSVAKTESRNKGRFKPEIVIVKKGENFIPRKGARLIEVSGECDIQYATKVLKAYRKAPPLVRSRVLEEKMTKKRDVSRRQAREEKGKGHMFGGGILETVEKKMTSLKTEIVEHIREEARVTREIFEETKFRANRAGLGPSPFLDGSLVGISAVKKFDWGCPVFSTAVDAAIALPAIAVFIISVHKLKQEVTTRWILAAIASGSIVLAKTYSLVNKLLIPFIAQLRKLVPGQGHMHGGDTDPIEDMLRSDPAALEVMELLRGLAISSGGRAEDLTAGYTTTFNANTDYKSKFYEQFSRWGIDGHHFVRTAMEVHPDTIANPQQGKWVIVGVLSGADGQPAMVAPSWGKQKRDAERMMYWKFMRWMKWECCHPEAVFKEHHCAKTFARRFGVSDYMKTIESRGANIPVPQGKGHGFTEDLISSMSRIGALAIVAITAKTAPSGKMLEKVMGFVGNFGKNVEGMHDFGTTAVSLLEGLVNTISKAIGVDQINLLETSITEVDAWREDAVKFCNSHSKANMSAVTKNECDVLYQRYCRLVARFPTGKVSNVIRMACGPLVKDIDRIRQEFSVSGIGLNQAKPRPLWVHIVGSPGVGKSLSMIPVFRRILLRDMQANGATVEQLQDLKSGSYDHAYIINSFEEYMSGYRENFAVLGDDFGQFLHAKGDPGEFNKYFVFAGEFPANVTMADLASKGNTYARSRFIFTTSNLTIKQLDAQLRENILTTPEAMLRRMDMIFYCYPAEKYRVDGWEDTNDQLAYRLDPKKLPVGDGFVADAMVFQRMRPVWKGGNIDRVDGEARLQNLDMMTNNVYREFGLRMAQSEAYAKKIDDDFCREVDEAIADAERLRGRGHMQAIPEEKESKGKEPEKGETSPPPEPLSLEGAKHIPDDQQRFYWNVKARARDMKPESPQLNESDIEYAERNVEVFKEDTEFAIQLIEVLGKMQVEPERLKTLVAKLQAPVSREEIDIRIHTLLTRALLQVFAGPLDDRIVWTMVGSTCRPSYTSMMDLPGRDEAWLTLVWPINKERWCHYYRTKKLELEKEQPRDLAEQLEAETTMERLKKSVTKAADNVKNMFTAYFEFTGWWGVAAPVIAGTLLVGGIAWWYLSGETEVEGEGHSAHRPMASKKKATVQRGKGHGVDSAVYDIADAVWNSCFFGVTAPSGDVITHSIVTGKEAIIPRHVREVVRQLIAKKDIDAGTIFTFRPVSAPGMTVENGFKVRADQIANAWSEGLWEKRDLAFLVLPIQKRADIRRYLFSEKDPYLNGDEQDILLLLERAKNPGHQLMVKVLGECFYEKNVYDVGGVDYRSERVVQIDSALPSSGDCCSPYFVIAPDSGGKKLLALHIAGNEQTWSLGTIFSREMYDTMDGMRRKDERVFPELPPTATGHMKLALDGRETPSGGAFQPIGRLIKPVWQPWQTELKEAFEGREWCERKLAPAPISKKEAFHKAVESYGKPYTPLSEEDLKMVKLACQGWLSSAEKAVKNKKQVPRRVLSDKEAVFGGEKGSALGELFTAMNFATSPGIIIGEEIKGPGKKEFFYRTADGTDIITEKGERLLNRVRLQVAMLKKGIRPFFVFRDFLKDELRKKAKVAAGMARFISGSPLDYQILCRMYFGAFAAFVQQGYTRNGTAIGMNPFHGDWHQFAEILRKYYKFNAGDFARYDTSLHPEIMLAICDMINKWYDDGEENAEIRRLLFLEVVNSRHVFLDVIYEWHGSEPSGHPLTAILNSIYTSIFFRLVFGHKNPRGKWAIVEFDEHCYFMGMGDDHVQANDEYAAQFMTPINVKEIAERYGMSYTTAEKEEVNENTPLLDFENVTFLKRGFLYGPDFGEWCAPLALDTVLEMALWSRGDTELERTRNVKQTFDHAVVELSLHPREVFDKYAPSMFTAFKEVYRFSYPIQDYETLRQKSRDKDFAPGGW